MEFALGQITGLAMAFIAVVAVTSVVGAITLIVATEDSLKFSPTFGEAYKISLIAALTASAICFPLGFVVGFAGKDFNVFGYILLAAIGFFSNAAVMASRLKHPERGQVSFGRACWLTTLQIVFSLMVASGLVWLFRFITT